MIWNFTIEGYIGIIISLFIIKTGIEIIKDTFDSIIGKRADSELTENLKNKLCSYDNVLGCYDLTLHNYGPNLIIGSAHIELPDDMRAKEIHKLTRKMTVDIYTEFGIVMTIGIYASNSGEDAEMIKNDLSSIISGYKEVLQLHGFYLDEEHKSVMFDLVIDFAADQKAISAEITDKIKEKYPDYSFYVVLDSDYSD